MKINRLTLITEDFKKDRNDLLDAIDILQKVKKEIDKKTDKETIDRAINKLRKVRNELPKDNLDFIKTIFMKILTLPLKMFT